MASNISRQTVTDRRLKRRSERTIATAIRSLSNYKYGLGLETEGMDCFKLIQSYLFKVYSKTPFASFGDINSTNYHTFYEENSEYVMSIYELYLESILAIIPNSKLYVGDIVTCCSFNDEKDITVGIVANYSSILTCCTTLGCTFLSFNGLKLKKTFREPIN